MGEALERIELSHIVPFALPVGYAHKNFELTSHLFSAVRYDIVHKNFFVA